MIYLQAYSSTVTIWHAHGYYQKKQFTTACDTDTKDFWNIKFLYKSIVVSGLNDFNNISCSRSCSLLTTNKKYVYFGLANLKCLKIPFLEEVIPNWQQIQYITSAVMSQHHINGCVIGDTSDTAFHITITTAYYPIWTNYNINITYHQNNFK